MRVFRLRQKVRQRLRVGAVHANLTITYYSDEYSAHGKAVWVGTKGCGKISRKERA